MPILFSIIESPAHPKLSDLYKKKGIEEFQLSSVRKAIQALKRTLPDFVVADFIYGYGNNYAGVNISNLDVFLYSLQKYKPDSKIILLVEKNEHQYVEKLHDIYPIEGVLDYPVDARHVEGILQPG